MLAKHLYQLAGGRAAAGLYLADGFRRAANQIRQSFLGEVDGPAPLPQPLAERFRICHAPPKRLCGWALSKPNCPMWRAEYMSIKEGSNKVCTKARGQ